MELVDSIDKLVVFAEAELTDTYEDLDQVAIETQLFENAGFWLSEDIERLHLDYSTLDKDDIFTLYYTWESAASNQKLKSDSDFILALNNITSYWTFLGTQSKFLLDYKSWLKKQGLK